jgi:hypothetical protein
MRSVLIGLVAASFSFATPLHAADICEAVALRAVAALEDASSFLRPGEMDGAVTQYRVNKKTGEDSLCSHGGYCYPVHVIENGQKVEVLRLTNCKIGTRVVFDDPDDVLYAVDVIRSAVSPESLKIDDVDNRLLELVLCSACAGNAAYNYVTKPYSQCAQIAKEALEGNPDAVSALNNNSSDYCSPAMPPNAPLAGAPSFNCRRAKSADEIIVCHDPHLARMDVNLAGLYVGLRSVANVRELKQLDSDQLKWMRRRQTCGWDAKCIAAAYIGRMLYLHKNRPVICGGPILQQPVGCDPGASFEMSD